MMNGCSTSGQAEYHLATLAVTLVISIDGGLVTGGYLLGGGGPDMMDGCSASGYAEYQLATLAVTLVISIVGGLVTG